MAGKKVENKDTEQKKVKKTTTSKKTGRSKSTANIKADKASNATVSKTTTARKRSNKESAVPELKERLSAIVPNAYGLDKFKDWTEQAEEVTCKALHVVVKSNAGRHCHNFQIKLYLRELAEKNGWALADLQLFDDHFEFTIVQPTIMKTLEVKLGN